MDKKYCKICGKEMEFHFTHDDGEWYTCNCEGVLEIAKINKEIDVLEKEIWDKQSRIKEIKENGAFSKMIEAHNKKLLRYANAQND